MGGKQTRHGHAWTENTSLTCEANAFTGPQPFERCALDLLRR